MKIQLTRPAQSGGAMAGLYPDTCVIEIADDAPIPANGVKVDPSTPVSDWAGAQSVTGFGAPASSTTGQGPAIAAVVSTAVKGGK